ncbi:MAG: DUF5397 family protein [Verrucomicrobiota bacterium]
MKAANKEFEHPEVIGQSRSFGSNGPVYHILEPSRINADGGWLLKVEVPVSCEVIEYPYAQLVADPLAV